MITPRSITAAATRGTLAICTSAFLALPTNSYAAQITTAEVVALPGASSGVNAFWTLSGDSSGSWVATVSTDASPGVQDGIFGVLAGSGVVAPAMLRLPETIGGYHQESVGFAKVRGDRIAYVASTLTATGLTEYSAWIDDELVVDRGDAIPGTDLFWGRPTTPLLTDGPSYFVSGVAKAAGPSAPPTSILVRYPSQTVLLSEGDRIPGLNGTIRDITHFSASPSGNHWTATVVFGQPQTFGDEQAILLNGSLYTPPNGPVTSTETGPWEILGRSFVDDDGTVVYWGRREGSFGEISRNGSFLAQSPTDISDNDAAWRALTVDASRYGIGATIDGILLDRPGTGSLDLNGDGIADPGWRAIPDATGQLNQAGAFIDEGRVLVLSKIQTPSGEVVGGVLRATLALPVDSVCEGQPNSTGRSASVRAIGSDAPSWNDLELLITDLPPLVLTLAIFSRTEGFVAQPAGSSGDLCLGGAIGRGVPLRPLIPDTTLSIRVFPSSMPQPNGPAAVLPGETWFMQAWYRDATPTGSTSNFTNAVAVAFR